MYSVILLSPHSIPPQEHIQELGAEAEYLALWLDCDRTSAAVWSKATMRKRGGMEMEVCGSMCVSSFVCECAGETTRWMD